MLSLLGLFFFQHCLFSVAVFLALRMDLMAEARGASQLYDSFEMTGLHSRKIARYRQDHAPLVVTVSFMLCLRNVMEVGGGGWVGVVWVWCGCGCGCVNVCMCECVNVCMCMCVLVCVCWCVYVLVSVWVWGVGGRVGGCRCGGVWVRV